MEWLADRLTSYIVKKKNIDEKSYEIYRYGMLTGLETILCMAICSIIAIHLKSFLELIVLLAVFFSLRAYVGGIHLKHFSRCLFFSCLIITFLLIIARIWIPDLRVAVAVTATALFLVNRLAPVATKDRIRDQDEATFFERQRKRILFGIACLDVAFIILGMEVFWSLIMYTILVVLISIILGFQKKMKVTGQQCIEIHGSPIFCESNENIIFK